MSCLCALEDGASLPLLTFTSTMAQCDEKNGSGGIPGQGNQDSDFGSGDPGQRFWFGGPRTVILVQGTQDSDFSSGDPGQTNFHFFLLASN